MEFRHWPDRDSSERKRDRADKRRSVGNRLRLARDEAFLRFVSPAQNAWNLAAAKGFESKIRAWLRASIVRENYQLQF
jgi:hypothetical protein